MNRTAARHGFTLIELLVVITIIVVLLALLTPALDKAITASQMAMCGANLDAVATTATVYAMDHKRFYPHRSGVRSTNADIVWWPDQLRDPRDNGVHDDRDELSGYMDINKHLNCPMVTAVDLTLDGLGGTSMILANYELYYGWGYRKPDRVGMFRVGDRWDSDNGDASRSYSLDVIACDVEYNSTFHNQAWSSHPDDRGVLGEMVYQNIGDAGSGGPNADAVAFGALLKYPILSMTWSRWDSRYDGKQPDDWNRGLIDRNFAYADGSVKRIEDIHVGSWAPDPRMLYTSQNVTAASNLHSKHLPRP